MKQCESCGRQMSEFDRHCPYCGAENRDIITAETETAEEPRPESGPILNEAQPQTSTYPMKWHKFLMVVMIIGAVLNAVSGMQLMNGSVYGADAAEVYARFPGMKGCDMFYGISVICLAVFQLYVRNRLHAFRSDGPKLITTLYAAALVCNIIYVLWASSVVSGSETKINLLDTQTISELIMSVLMLMANTVYYRKRQALFVN